MQLFIIEELSSFMDRKVLQFVYELICFSLIVNSQQRTENGTHKMFAVNDSNVFRTNGQKKERKSKRKMKKKEKKEDEKKGKRKKKLKKMKKERKRNTVKIKRKRK